MGQIVPTRSQKIVALGLDTGPLPQRDVGISVAGEHILQQRDNHFRSLFVCCVHVGYPSAKQRDDFLNRPDVIGNTRFHRWRHTERLMAVG
jgi:hypothetical protein